MRPLLRATIFGAVALFCATAALGQTVDEDAARNLVLFMPYLHWESDRGRVKSDEMVKEAHIHNVPSISEVVNHYKSKDKERSVYLFGGGEDYGSVCHAVYVGTVRLVSPRSPRSFSTRILTNSLITASRLEGRHCRGLVEQRDGGDWRARRRQRAHKAGPGREPREGGRGCCDCGKVA